MCVRHSTFYVCVTFCDLDVTITLTETAGGGGGGGKREGISNNGLSHVTSKEKEK